MAETTFDCHACTNEAYSQRFDAFYCLPHISTGKSPIKLIDMGGSKHGDRLVCDCFTTAPRPVVIYEAVSVFNDEHPCNEPEWEEE